MIDIEHSIQGDDGAEIEVQYELGSKYLKIMGNGAVFLCYMDDEHLRTLCDELYRWGITPSEQALVEFGE